MTCFDVRFCEPCYNLHVLNCQAEEKRGLRICHTQHEHFENPVDGWTMRDDETMTIDGKIFWFSHGLTSSNETGKRALLSDGLGCTQRERSVVCYDQA